MKSFLTEALKQEAEKISKLYKIGKVKAYQKLDFEIGKNKKLLNILEARNSSNQILKNKDYKNLIKKIKKEIYFNLRKFQEKDKSMELAKEFKSLAKKNDQKGISEILSKITDNHASTRERTSSNKKALQFLDKYVSKSGNIVDFGCGVFPLTLNFKKYKNLKQYIAIETNQVCLEILKSFRKFLNKSGLKTDFIVINPKNEEFDFKPKKAYDLTLIFKTVAQIKRIDRKIYEKLTTINSKVIIVSESTESLVKRKNIKQKQKGILIKFAKQSKKKIIERFETQNEIFYVLKHSENEENN